MGTSFHRFIGFPCTILSASSGPTIVRETASPEDCLLSMIGCAGHPPSSETLRAALLPTHPRK